MLILFQVGRKLCTALLQTYGDLGEVGFQEIQSAGCVLLVLPGLCQLGNLSLVSDPCPGLTT